MGRISRDHGSDGMPPEEAGPAGLDPPAIPPTVRLRRGRANRVVAATASAAVLAAAAIVWAASGGAAPDDRLLVVDESGAIALIDPATGEATYTLPGAVPTPDRSALLTTRPFGGQTRLESRDPATGEVTGSTMLDGEELTVRAVSPRGGAVALMPGPPGPDLYVPEPRRTTSITVSYTDDRPARSYDLAGNFEPEMFSLDETALFLLEFTPATDPSGYYVRRLDLASGSVTDTYAPQVVLNPKMGGRARAQVLHPEGTHLFTLYTLPDPDVPVHDLEAEGDTARWAFVHVINLAEEWSYCIFLPVPIGTVDEAAVGMGISPDGSALLVADPSTSTLATVDVASLSVVDTVGVEELRGSRERAAVAVAPDGTVYVASGSRLFELDPRTLEPVWAWMGHPSIAALSVSAAGDELRVAAEGAITIVDRATREEAGVLRAPGSGTVSLLGPPRGSVTEFPLECAC